MCQGVEHACEDLKWRLKGVARSWPAVQVVGDVVELILAVDRHAGHGPF